MKKEELSEEQKRLEDMLFTREKSEEWLKAHNFNPKVWGFAKVALRTPRDKEIMVGEYLLKTLPNNKLGFVRVSCIRNNKLFINQIHDKETKRVFSRPYRTRRGGYVVLRKHRYDSGGPKEEIFFRGMKMSPVIHLGDEPLETSKAKCPFCGTWKNLTFAGGEAAGSRDFSYAYFCERCKILVYFGYDCEDGPIVKKVYRKLISQEAMGNAELSILVLEL